MKMSRASGLITKSGQKILLGFSDQKLDRILKFGIKAHSLDSHILRKGILAYNTTQAGWLGIGLFYVFLLFTEICRV